MSVDMPIKEIQDCVGATTLKYLVGKLQRLICATRPYKSNLKDIIKEKNVIYSDTDSIKVKFESKFTRKEKLICNTLSTLEYQFARNVMPNLSSHRSILCTPVGIARPSTTLSKTDRMNTNL